MAWKSVLGAILFLAPIGAIALPVAAQVDIPDYPACEERPETPFSAAEKRQAQAVMRAVVHNSGASKSARLCLWDQDGAKRFDETIVLPARDTFQLDVIVPYPDRPPQNAYKVDFAFQIETGSTTGLGGINLAGCRERAAAISFDTYDDGVRVPGAGPDGCLSGVPIPQSQAFTPTWASVGLVGGLVAVVGFSGWWFRWPLLAFFTRLHRPTVLDQATRARVYDLVQLEPGIHAKAVIDRLELGTGQGAYHLRVLVRQHLLVEWKGLGYRHYFPANTYSATQLRSVAALRNPSLARLYEEIRRSPGLLVSEAARRTDLRLPHASRLAKRLEDAGLVHRRPGPGGTRLMPRSE